MGSFFDEDIVEEKNDMIRLKRMVKVVSTSSYVFFTMASHYTIPLSYTNPVFVNKKTGSAIIFLNFLP